MYLDDIPSLITIACCVPELRTIDPFPIENVLGGGQLLPPLVHSLWEIDRIRWLTTPIPNKLLWSCKLLRYHLSTSYSTFWEIIWAIQQCWLISEQEVTSAENGLFFLPWHHLKMCTTLCTCIYAYKPLIVWEVGTIALLSGTLTASDWGWMPLNGWTLVLKFLWVWPVND